VALQSGAGLGIELLDLGIQPLDSSLQLRRHGAPSSRIRRSTISRHLSTCKGVC
jgi:hypothetical protein